MARRSLLQDTELSRGGDGQRRNSLTIQNPNVFSDDYALEPLDSSGEVTPVEAVQDSREHLSLGHHNTNSESLRDNSQLTLLNNGITLNRPTSISKRIPPNENASIPRRNVSMATQSDVGTQRTFSTSTRFSIPRSQSPYVGPTAPSQPYGLYPQITRASSIASESTTRQHDQPFIPQGGPAHPYSMYPQNTSPEEDSASSEIPLGFPGLGQNYEASSRSRGDDIGDIVGSDGHIEQLPPYTRYADNVVAKGDMARIEEPVLAVIEEPVTPIENHQTITPTSDVRQSFIIGREEEAVARKEGWIRRNRYRKCCGMPLWMVILIATVILLAAAIGGVIGGVVGNDKGTDSAIASAASTTTVWLDADPVSTGPSATAVPTGHYAVPLQQTQSVDSCIDKRPEADSWGCMDAAEIGITVSCASSGSNLQVVFDDYSNSPQMFRYGAQPPDFNSTVFDLQPFNDKTDDQLGVAMFFSVLFDKIVILPEDAITDSNSGKVDDYHVFTRNEPWDHDFLAVGDTPWYCFWNSTINEFWIFIEQDLANSTAFASAYSQTTATTKTSSTTSSNGYSQPTNLGSNNGATPVSVTSLPNYMPASSYEPFPTSASYLTWSTDKERRGSPKFPDYPKLIKMVEKRKPQNNTQPYCQKMQVLNDWQIMPIPNVPTLCIEETELNPLPARGNRRQWSKMLDRRDVTEQLDSKCVCEWLST